MSSSRRSSKQSDTNNEFMLECKAAFLSIYDDISDKIESKKRLNNVLQQSGRNPTKTSLDKYWPRNTEELSFIEFVEVCKKEPVTTADDLMKAFRKIDVNGDGYISLDELFKIMNAQGENMSREDVRKMIDEVDDNKDGRLDYGEFTNMIMKTTQESKKVSMKLMEKKEKKKKRDEKLRNTASRMESGKLSYETKIPEKNKHEIPSENVDEVHKSNEITDSQLDETTPSDSAKWNSKSQGLGGSGIIAESLAGSDTKVDDSLGSVLSMKSKKKHSLGGSLTSLRSDGKRDNMGSQVSVRTLQEEQTGSKVSVRVTDDFGSKSSLKSKNATTSSQLSLNQASQGSRLSVKPVKKDNMGSKTSLRSLKEMETTTQTKGADLGKPGSDHSANKSCDHDNQTESPKKDSPKASPRSRSDSGGKHSLKKGTTPREHAQKDSGTKETPRRELHAKHDKPPLPDSPKSKDAGADKTKSKVEMPKTGSSKDSARTVGEEIDYNDDFDIVSTGRPTPRIDLNARTGDTPRKGDKDTKEDEKVKSETKKEKDVKGSAREVKDENSLGSHTSLRSGNKEISAPVPSPRKNVSRLSEDDVPRPSPRVTKRDTKGKPLSTKNRDKLPDLKSVQDWMHYTSKGCFFYEDDEIVTHVYSLTLTADSSVYLSAHPIQEPDCLNLPGSEPIDTAIFVFDSRGKLVTCSEHRDTRGTYSLKCDLSAGEYQVLPYTTGCRFRKRPEEMQDNMKESKLVKTRDDKIVITSAFRDALDHIFDLCDLDGNGTMSRDEFNWFNLRTSGEELGDDEWEVVEEKTELTEGGEITKKDFIALNVMEAEDAQGDVEDLWITLTSMGMNKGLIMDEACPYKVDVYVEESGRKRPTFRAIGIESLEKKEYVSEICQYTIEKAEEPTKIRNMKDLYMYTHRNEYRATIVIDNRSRSNVTLQVNCSRSKNVVSNRPGLDCTIEIDPQGTTIAHHLLPKNELSDWTISCTETIHK